MNYILRLYHNNLIIMPNSQIYKDNVIYLLNNGQDIQIIQNSRVVISFRKLV